MSDVVRCHLPVESRLAESLPRVAYVDSFAAPARIPGQDMVAIYAAALGHMPEAFKRLIVLRSQLVKPFGIRGVSREDMAQPIDISRDYAVGDRIGRWTLFARHDDELITGADDRHLDFRVSVLRTRDRRIVLSTAVMPHNAFGRAYLTAILRFHRFGVASLLRNASAAGRF